MILEVDLKHIPEVPEEETGGPVVERTCLLLAESGGFPLATEFEG